MKIDEAAVALCGELSGERVHDPLSEVVGRNHIARMPANFGDRNELVGAAECAARNAPSPSRASVPAASATEPGSAGNRSDPTAGQDSTT